MALKFGTADGYDGCVCQQGYANNIFGFCIKCETLNNHIFFDNECVCMSGFSPIAKGVCQDDCTILDQNSKFDQVKQGCACIPGFEDSTGSCKDKCLLIKGSVADGQGNCLCDGNSKIFNNECRLCSEIHGTHSFGDGDQGCKC